VSLVGLAIVLLVFRQLRTLVPAVWTVLVTSGVIYLLGHPISIGTCMVTNIALGAGVDFAIHLGVRARQSSSPEPGREATDALGGVILVTGVQLAVAFLVLLASEMPPLQQFGAGLAIGLLGAATGAVWLTPRLYRRR
jgi:predicted RND superfamily exporter protein